MQTEEQIDLVTYLRYAIRSEIKICQHYLKEDVSPSWEGGAKAQQLAEAQAKQEILDLYEEAVQSQRISWEMGEDEDVQAMYRQSAKTLMKALKPLAKTFYHYNTPRAWLASTWEEDRDEA